MPVTSAIVEPVVNNLLILHGATGKKKLPWRNHPINHFEYPSLTPLNNLFILQNGSPIDVDDETITVRGFAWSGGGRGVIRVDVSCDDGVSWHTAGK